MNLIKILQENRLMKTPQEINLFEETLEKLAKYPDDKDLMTRLVCNLITDM